MFSAGCVCNVFFVFVRLLAYPASAARSPASIFSVASSCMPSITWLYVSRVMPMEA